MESKKPWLLLALIGTWAFMFCLHACQPSPSPAAVSPASSEAAPCDIADALTQGRMIRNPNTGMAEVVPCDAGR